MLDEPALQAILLGILQGLTEFLPISSSGHLLLLPWVMRWEAMGLTFDVVLHVGTLAAVLAYFWRDWRSLLLGLLGRRAGDEFEGATPSLGILIAASLPAVAVGLLFEDAIENVLRGPGVVIFDLAFFALLLGAADRWGGCERGGEEIGYKEALVIGAAQALALAPGVSRSGITITAALFLGFRRWDAARFSFLMAAPVIAGAAALRLLDLWRAGLQGPATPLALALGALVSAASGWLCIKYFLRYLKSRSLMPFVAYRLALAALALALWLG